MEKPTFVRPVLCVVAGHSGGHIIPARTLAEQWLKKHPHGRCIFFTTDHALDKHILKGNAMIIEHVPLKCSTLTRKQLWKLPWHAGKGIFSFLQSYWTLSGLPIDKVVTTGGAIALPVCFAAKLLGIPIEVFELNAVPGKAVKILTHIAKKTYVCFAQAQQYFNNKNTVLTGYPLQSALHAQPLAAKDARTSLRLDPDAITLLVLGGSQGSVFINNLIKKWSHDGARKYNNIQIIHQTGPYDKTDWKSVYTSHNIPALVFPFTKDMHTLYCAADIIICRAGAGSLFEAIHYKKKCITIPLESLAGNHQVINALAMEKQFPAYIQVIRQPEITHDISAFTQVVHQAIQKIGLN